LFAGIGGFDLGFERAGFAVSWQAERDTGAQHVLCKRFQGVQLYGDVHDVDEGSQRVDVITGGFPCQDVSVAGTRKGLAGSRTGLFWQIVRVARALQPRWMVLENVPGLLSSHGGRDFYTVLQALAELGFRRGYRILDSRYFGVPQRRRRVFIILRARDAGDGAESVLFESESRDGDSPASAEARPRVAATLRGRSHGAGVNAPGRGGEDDQNFIAFGWNKSESQTMRTSSDDVDALQASATSNPAIALGVHANQRGEIRTSGLAGSLNGSRSGKQYEGVFATLNSGGNDGGFRTEPGEHLIEVARPLKSGGNDRQDESHETYITIPERARALTGSMWKGHDDDTDTLIPLPSLQASMGHHGHSSPRGDGHDPIVAFALRSDLGGTGQGHNMTYPGGVRRLTPLECERLQGFPDGWTCLCGKGHLGSKFCECADSPRYKQLGNAVTVPVAEWIARRIIQAEGD